MSSNNKFTIGIVAHVDSGKTTLSESILYNAGAIKKLGRVDTKDTFLDTDNIEKSRGITIYTKDARFTYGGTDFVLIDTPGHVDFSTEMERALSVIDAAVLLISASSGIQSHTKTLWSLLRSYKVPTFIFVNKMDMPGVNKSVLLSSINAKLSDMAIDFSEDSSSLYEDIATAREDLLETYLNEGTISDSDVSDCIKDRLIFPVLFGSALKNSHIDKLLNCLVRFAPSKSYNNTDSLSALCYKISFDEHGKRLSHIKLFSGHLSVKDMLGNEKINEIRLYSGNKYVNTTNLEAGDVCTIVGLLETKNGDVFGSSLNVKAPVLAPALSYAVHFSKDTDTNTMLRMLKQLEEEDPLLNVEYNEETHEIFVSLMGDVQTEVLTAKIKSRFGVDVTFTDGKICYKETVTRTVEGVGHFEPLRHYAEAHIRIEPLPVGSGLQFECSIPEDLLAKNWQRLIFTHLCEREHRGVLIGAPITDVKLSLVSGKAHLKHTEGGDFRQATYRAIRQGLMALNSIGACHILEPYYSYTLVIPDDYVGRAMTDITQMSGTSAISENDYDNKITVLTGRAPVSTLNGYVKEVTAYTKGQGQLSLAFDGYDLCHNEDEVLASSLYNPDADLRNPSSSVFCSHGAGTTIPWDEVSDYMHISYASKDGAFGLDSDSLIMDLSELDALKAASRANQQRINSESSNPTISIEEIDNIIHATSHANKNGRQGAYKGISGRSHTKATVSTVSSSKLYKGAAIKPKYMLVDGYNVIHAWPELSDLASITLDGAVTRFNDILCNYQAFMDIPLTVVYDAYKVKGHSTEILKYNNITVVFTKEAQTADQYIERYAHENSKKFDITVVTSDGVEQLIVMGNNCTIMSSREFLKEVEYRTQI